MLDTAPSSNDSSWRIPVLKTNALSNEGTDELLDSINSHFKFMKKEEILKEKNNDRYQRQVKSIIQNRFSEHFWAENSKHELLSIEIKKEISERLSPVDLVDNILKNEKY